MMPWPLQAMEIQLRVKTPIQDSTIEKLFNYFQEHICT